MEKFFIVLDTDYTTNIPVNTLLRRVMRASPRWTRSCDADPDLNGGHLGRSSCSPHPLSCLAMPNPSHWLFHKALHYNPITQIHPLGCWPSFSSKSERNKRTLCRLLTDSAYKKLEQPLHRGCWLKTRPVSSFSSGIHLMIKQFYRCESFFPQNRTKLLCNVENLLLSASIYYSTAWEQQEGKLQYWAG